MSIRNAALIPAVAARRHSPERVAAPTTTPGLPWVGGPIEEADRPISIRDAEIELRLAA